MTSIDITVRGAGAFGLGVAFACLRRGARVQIVDPHGVGAGASGGIVGALAPHVPENWNAKKAFQLDSLLMAQSWWSDVSATGGGDPLYRRSGRIQPVVEGRALELAHQRALGAQDLWRGQAEWRVEPVGADWAPLSPSGWVIHDTLSAQLHPKRACQALAAACQAMGALVVPDAPTKGIELLATGAAGLETLSAELQAPIGQGIKGQAALLRYDANGLPQLFAEGVHVVPHPDGTVAIGSTTERDFDGLGTDALLDDVVATARAAVPALRTAPEIARWAGLRPRARSRAPILGAHPKRDQVFIANGGFKIGFGMAPKVAEVMADLLLEGRDAIPEDFRVEAALPKTA